MQVEETRVVVLPVPEAWGEMGLGESKAKAIITLKELLAYELPEVSLHHSCRACHIARAGGELLFIV